MTTFIADHRSVFGVGPICRVLPIAPSTYYARRALELDPELASDRARRDASDKANIQRVFDASRGRYGARKVWHALRREGKDIAHCAVERLMKAMKLQGGVRGGKVITTNPDAAQPCPDDKMNREFVAPTPNRLWVSDFTYVSSWQGSLIEDITNDEPKELALRFREACNKIIHADHITAEIEQVEGAVYPVLPRTLVLRGRQGKRSWQASLNVPEYVRATLKNFRIFG